MLNKELIQRIEKFVQSIPPHKGEVYLDRYFKKLQAETELQGYRIIGTSVKLNMLSADIKYKDIWYRISLVHDDEKYSSIQILNQEDFTDVYSFGWVNQMEVMIKLQNRGQNTPCVTSE